MSSVIVGIFDTQAAANEAKDRLLLSGFANDTVVASNEEMAIVRSNAVSGSTGALVQEQHEPEGAISRFFSSIFGSDHDPDPYHATYQEAMRRGHYGVSVSVHSEGELARAEAILNEYGAIDIDESSEQWRGEGWVADRNTLVNNTPLANAAVDTSAAVAGNASGTLKEIAEELKVGKRSVARGGVRVFSQMVERPVQETVSLREEHVDVERRAVDRPATEADFAAFKEGSIEVREMAEEAVVSKEARVVGEVDIDKTVTQRDETVQDTVRETHVEVEQIDPHRTAPVATGTATNADPLLNPVNPAKPRPM